MNVNDFIFSRHALDRLLDMQVDGDEVRRCLEFPSRLAESTRDPGRYLYYGNRITCIVDVKEDAKTVVTVVWRTNTDWEKDFKKYGEYSDRTYRGNDGLGYGNTG